MQGLVSTIHVPCNNLPGARFRRAPCPFSRWRSAPRIMPAARRGTQVYASGSASSGSNGLQAGVKVILGGSFLALVAAGVAAFSQPPMSLLAEGTMTQAAASKLGDGVVSFLNTLNLTQHQAWGVCAALFVALYAAIQPLLAPGKVVNKAATPSTPSGDSAPAQASPSTAVSDQKEAAPQEQASVKAVSVDVPQPTPPAAAQAEQEVAPVAASMSAVSQKVAPVAESLPAAGQEAAPAAASASLPEQEATSVAAAAAVVDQETAPVEASISADEQALLAAAEQDAQAKARLAERVARARIQRQVMKEAFQATRELGLAWVDAGKARRELQRDGKVPEKVSGEAGRVQFL